jgi:hypothetical protein
MALTSVSNLTIKMPEPSYKTESFQSLTCVSLAVMTYRLCSYSFSLPAKLVFSLNFVWMTGANSE